MIPSTGSLNTLRIAAAMSSTKHSFMDSSVDAATNANRTGVFPTHAPSHS